MNIASTSSILILSDLIKELKNSPIHKYGAILKRVQIPASEMLPCSSWSKDGYTRNCVFRNEQVEVIALCWNAGDVTPIHDHAGEKCWAYQVSGSIEESRFVLDNNNRPKLTGVNTLTRGMLCYIDDELGYHQIKNATTQKAISLHIYAKPIRACSIYDQETRVFQNKEMAYDATIILD